MRTTTPGKQHVTKQDDVQLIWKKSSQRTRSRLKRHRLRGISNSIIPGFRFFITAIVLFITFHPVQSSLFYKNVKSCTETFGADHTGVDLKIKIICKWEDQDTNEKGQCVFQEPGRHFLTTSWARCGDYRYEGEIIYKICNMNPDHRFRLNIPGSAIRFNATEVLLSDDFRGRLPVYRIIESHECEIFRIERTFNTCDRKRGMAIYARGHYLDEDGDELPNALCDLYGHRWAEVGYEEDNFPSASPSFKHTISSPTVQPSKRPSTWPSVAPSLGPSAAPSFGPSSFSMAPSKLPTMLPSQSTLPSTVPSTRSPTPISRTAIYSFDVEHDISCITKYVQIETQKALSKIGTTNTFDSNVEFSAGEYNAVVSTSVANHTCLHGRNSGDNNTWCALVTTEMTSNATSTAVTNYSVAMRKQLSNLINDQSFRDGLFNEHETCVEVTPIEFDFADDIEFKTSCIEQVLEKKLNETLLELKLECSNGATANDENALCGDFSELSVDTMVSGRSHCQQENLNNDAVVARIDEDLWWCALAVHKIKVAVPAGGDKAVLRGESLDAETARARENIHKAISKLSNTDGYKDALAGKMDTEFCT